MHRKRIQLLLASLVCTAGIVATTPAAAIGKGDDASRLARATQDVTMAEQALQANAAAAVTFGPMLRDARAHLEAGLAAAALNHIEITKARSVIDATSGASNASDGVASASSHDRMQRSSAEQSLASNAALLLHRRLHRARLIWA